MRRLWCAASGKFWFRTVMPLDVDCVHGKKSAERPLFNRPPILYCSLSNLWLSACHTKHIFCVPFNFLDLSNVPLWTNWYVIECVFTPTAFLRFEEFQTKKPAGHWISLCPTRKDPFSWQIFEALVFSNTHAYEDITIYSSNCWPDCYILYFLLLHNL